MSITAWRMTKAAYEHTAFEGEGARRFGGRFNSKGMPVVYTAATASLAVLEILANLQFHKPLGSYILIPVTFDESLVETVEIDEMPVDWNRPVPPPSIRQIGDRWIRTQSSLVLCVPSAILPIEYNYLINPNHPDIDHLDIGTPAPLPIDPRLVE